MTSKQLVNHLCYEYNGVKNYNEERLKASQELKRDLEILEILRDKLYYNCQSNVEERFCHKIIMKLILLTDDEYEKIKEWLENEKK